jgi:glycosyltransferase involved in cell wall biosynthesis
VWVSNLLMGILHGSWFGMSFPRKNMISVALCTYNGEQFLPEQLDSMQQQTRLPDELVVCDDRSTDRTLEIVREFAASFSFPVKVVVNEKNLGSSKNFEKAIRLCSGDLIALSDQDDVWYPMRLERSEQELLAHPEVGLVFSDGDIIDDQGRATGKTLWQSYAFTETKMADLLAGKYDLLLKHRFVTGATVMFRATLRDRCLPLPPGWVHDEWIAALVPAFSGLRPINEALIRYRQHASQQIGSPSEVNPRWKVKDHWNTLVKGEKTKKYWNNLSTHVRFAEEVCNTLSEISLDERGCGILSSYQAWLQFASFRCKLPRQRLSRLAPVLKKHSWYAVHAFGFKSALKDILRSRPR